MNLTNLKNGHAQNEISGFAHAFFYSQLSVGFLDLSDQIRPYFQQELTHGTMTCIDGQFHATHKELSQ